MAKPKKKWIQKAIKKPGALRRQLGIRKGQKIPVKLLKSSAKRPGKLGQRARLALTLRKLRHKKSKRGVRGGAFMQLGPLALGI